MNDLEIAALRVTFIDQLEAAFQALSSLTAAAEDMQAEVRRIIEEKLGIDGIKAA